MLPFCEDSFWNVQLTWSSLYPEFSACFEDTVLTYIPVVVLLCGSLIYVVLTKENFSKTAQKSPWTLLLIAKLIMTSLLALMWLVDLPWKSTTAGITAGVIDFFSMILIIYLLLNDKRRMNCRSALLFAFWLTKTIAFLPRYYRTVIYLISDHQLSHTRLEQHFVVASLIAYPIVFINFILSCWSDTALLPSKKGRPCPLLHASPLSVLAFDWMTPFLMQGYKRYVSHEDLCDPLPDITMKNNYYLWEKHWNKELLRSGFDAATGTCKQEKSAPSLFRSFIRTFWPNLAFGFFLTFLRSVLRSTPALMLSLITTYLSNPMEPQWHGVLYALCIFVSSFICALLFRHTDNMLMLAGLRIKSVLIGAIYRKSLRLSSLSQNTYPTGEIVNMISVDADRIVKLCISSSILVASPATIIITLILLWQYLGPACLAGTAVFLVVMPISGLLGRRNRRVQEAQMKLKDKRMTIMNEIFNGINIIKLFAWEPPFTQRVLSTRTKEVKKLKRFAYFSAVISFFWTCTPFLVGLCSFAAFVFSSENNILNPTIAFVSLTLFNQMRFSIVLIPDFVANFIQIGVSFRRIREFLLASEIDISVKKIPDPHHDVIISNGTFSWNIAKDAVLTNINIQVPKSKLVAVVGKVGSGKSSLLSAMMGNLRTITGTTQLSGSVGYVPQTAWIRNATVRDNIVFTSEWNSSKYNRILQSCCLETDIQMFPGGDDTEIGEKGINLSGGQKQRVSIARAVYQNRDIYLFDDPLSAVDAHVGAKLFKDVIGPKGLLKNKTRILVTNNLSVLNNVDHIYVIHQGQIIEEGTYTDLVPSNGIFSDLVREFSQQKEKPNDSEEIIHEEHLKHRRRTISRSIENASESEKFEKSSHTEHRLIDNETVEEGGIQLRIYVNYIRYMGLPLASLVIFCYATYRALDITNGLWLSQWSMDPPFVEGKRDFSQQAYRLLVYTAIGLSQGLVNFIGVAMLAKAAITASNRLHSLMLNSVMRAPLSFFEATPMGRLFNRFGKDLDQLDLQMTNSASFFLELTFQAIGMIILISAKLPIYLVISIPVLIVFIALRQLFVKTLRQVKRLESVARSPVNNHMSETVSGLSSIRAYEVQAEFEKQNDQKVDVMQNCAFYVYLSNYWISVRLELLGGLLILCMTLLVVFNRETIDAGTAGLMISYSLASTVAFNFLMYFSAEVEALIVSAERMDEYTTIQPEAPWQSSHPPSIDWPERGEIKFDNFSTRYRTGLDLVLKNISLDVEPLKKIGVVGRTGAGKSSLILSFFRVLEAVSGKIIIDDVDISTIGLHELRSKLTIIPQDSVLFSGDIRGNLDPNGEYTDADMFNALELAHLKENFLNSDGLCYAVSEGGQNLSAGQRQLVCLARAVLRRSKILVLDEATAAVDLETDSLIQETIRSVFKDSTIITIAHRVHTILDSDLVIVMENGAIVEKGGPQELLQNDQSRFFGLCREAGVV